MKYTLPIYLGAFTQAGIPREIILSLGLLELSCLALPLMLGLILWAGAWLRVEELHIPIPTRLAGAGRRAWAATAELFERRAALSRLSNAISAGICVLDRVVLGKADEKMGRDSGKNRGLCGVGEVLSLKS